MNVNSDKRDWGFVVKNEDWIELNYDNHFPEKTCRECGKHVSWCQIMQAYDRERQTVVVPLCPNCYKVIQKRLDKCRSCEGTGEFHWGNSTGKCGMCNGTGKKIIMKFDKVTHE